MSEIGLAMKLMRVVRGYSQGELGELVGCDQRDISKIENGIFLPTPELEAKIKKALGFQEAIDVLDALERATCTSGDS